MRKILLLFFVTIIASSISAQRKIMYIEPFTSSNENVSYYIINAIRSSVCERIDNMGRIDLLVGKNNEDNSSSIEMADFIICGNILSSDTEIEPGKRNEPDRYVTKIKGYIELIDTKTKSAVEKKQFETSGYSEIKVPNIPNTDKRFRNEVRRLENEAYNKSVDSAINNCNIYVNDMIDHNVKIYASITAIDNKTKDEVGGVIINKGSSDGVSKGQRFIVSIVSNNGNYPTIRKIGEIRVKEQPTPYSAMCKFVSGKKEILEALNSKAELTIVNRTAKIFDF